MGYENKPVPESGVVKLSDAVTEIFYYVFDKKGVVMKRFFGFLLAVVMIEGCKIPDLNREGALYCYTADYRECGFPFSPFPMCWKFISGPNRDGDFNIFPPMGELMLALPIMMVEQFVICPVFDTVMIPYDLFMKWKNSSVCANDGVWITVIDRCGAPIPEITINLEVGKLPKRRIVYDGNVQDKIWRNTCIKTDTDGRAYVPIKIGSCSCVQYSGSLITTKGMETFFGEFDFDTWMVRIGSCIKGRGYWGRPYYPVDWQNRWWWREGRAHCYHCDKVTDFQKSVNGMGVWTVSGTCRYCGRTQTRKRARAIELELRKSRVTWPKTKEEYMVFNALTGLPLDKIEEICGKCQQSDGSKHLVVRLEGEFSRKQP